MKKLTSIFISCVILISLFSAFSFDVSAEIIPTVTFSDTNNLQWVVTNNTSLDAGYNPWYDHTSSFSLTGFDNAATIQTKRYEPAAEPWKTLYKSNVENPVATFTVNKTCEIYVLTGITASSSCLKWLINDGYELAGTITATNAGITLNMYKKSFVVPEGETLDIPIGTVNSNWYNQMCTFVIKWLEPKHPITISTESKGKWTVKPDVQIGDKIYTDQEYILKDYSTDDSKKDINELGLSGSELIMTANADNSDETCNSSSSDKLTWVTITLENSAEIYVASVGAEDSQGRWMNWLTEEGFTQITDADGNPEKLYIYTTYNQPMVLHKKEVIVPEGETVTVNLGKVGAWQNVMYFGLVKWIKIYDEPIELITDVSYSYDTVTSDVIVTLDMSADLGTEMSGAEIILTVKDSNGNPVGNENAVIDGEGNLNVSVNISYIPGEYKVLLESSRISGPSESTIIVSDVADIIILLDNIKNNIITDGAGLEAVLSDDTKNLKLDKTVYNLMDYDNKVKTAGNYLNAMSLYTVEEFIEIWDGVISKSGLNSKNKDIIAKVFELYEEEIGIKTQEKAYADYNTLSSKESVYSELAMSEYSDNNAFIDKFTETVAMATLKNVSGKTQITLVINNYPSVFGYDTNNTNYILYEGYVTDYVLNNLTNINAPSDLVDVINSGIAEAVIVYNANLPVVGGGGGGGGGSSSRPVQNVEVSKDIAEELPDDIDYEAEVSYKDVDDNHWAYKAIKSLTVKNIISGSGDGNFNPESYITRAEFTKIIVTALGIEISSSEKVFDDVSENAWYFEYISAGYKAGIIKGNGESFSPDSSITRQDAFLILYNAIKPEAGEITSFEDSKEIAEYAIDAVNALYSKGLVSGYNDNTIKPLNRIKRSEAAQLIFNMLESERVGD